MSAENADYLNETNNKMVPSTSKRFLVMLSCRQTDRQASQNRDRQKERRARQPEKRERQRHTVKPKINLETNSRDINIYIEL